MASNKKKNKAFSIVFVVLFALVILIYILINKDTIITNLKETHFFDRVFGKTPEFVENHPSSQLIEQETGNDNTITIKVEPEKKKSNENPKNESSSKTESTAKIISEEENSKAVEENKTEEVIQQKKAETEKKVISYTEVQLCFVEIDAEGSVIRKMIKRSIPKSDSPLSDSIKSLLEGPDASKAAEKNCMSLIPEGTKLLGAKVQNGVAYLDFSENFEINPYGVEGFNAQLMQIVYTATNFSTVKSVQFLIEGQKKEYLGSEGQWIGSPLSKGSF